MRQQRCAAKRGFVQFTPCPLYSHPRCSSMSVDHSSGCLWPL